MRGLKENCHEGTDGWLSVSRQLVSMYYDLCEVVSADMDHIRYRKELRLVNQSPCVPILSEFLLKEHACVCVCCQCVYMHMSILTQCLCT